MTLAYCTKEDVKELTNVQGKHWFKKEQDPTTALNNMLDKWIQISSSVISKYCNREWTVEDNDLSSVPSNIRLATSIAVSNIIAFAQTRRDTPIINKDDWNVNFSNNSILTDDVKELIDPYVKESKNRGSDFFCVSGE